MRLRRILFVLFVCLCSAQLLLLETACTRPGIEDETKEEKKAPKDAGEDTDKGKPDDNNTDKGKSDAGDPDKGKPDNGSPDTNKPDNGTPDNGNPDNGNPDTNKPDNGSPDTNKPDNGNPDNGPIAGDLCVLKKGGKELLIEATLILPDKLLPKGQILIGTDGKIACVGVDCLSKANSPTQIICAGGVLSPGLINPHEHITWSLASPHKPGKQRYDHRHEWRKGKNGKPKVPAPGGNSSREAVAWGELRMLMSGVTTIVGSGGAPGLARNLDRDRGGLPGTLRYSTFPLGDSSGSLTKTGCGNYKIESSSSIQKYNAYLPHVAEGIGESATNEFRCMSTDKNGGQQLVVSRSAFIHAIGLDPTQIALMARAGTSLIWSPRSNIDLYGHTAMIPLFLKQGVNIALGTDWMISGSMNMLRELQCADYLNKNHFNKILSDQQLIQMATFGGALATKTEKFIGALKAGLYADLALYDGRTNKGYRAILDAKNTDVRLVIRGGKVLYGDAMLVEGLVNNGGNDCDALDVCGMQKRVCIKTENISSNAKDLASLTSFVKTKNPNPYPLFTCNNKPKDEPTCVPSRPGEFGQSQANDKDGDGIEDSKDNCPQLFNPIRPMDNKKQGDVDGDGKGDICDPCPLSKDNSKCKPFDPKDRDSDGVENTKDNCPNKPNPKQEDADKDGQGDVCDACPQDANPNGGACPASIYDIKTKKIGTGSVVQLNNLLVTAVEPRRQRVFFQVKKGDAAYKGEDNSGVMLYAGKVPTEFAKLKPGDRVSLQATASEYRGQIQLINPTKIVVKAGTEALPAPVVVKPSEINTATAKRTKALEGVIVQVQAVEVTSANPAAPSNDYGEFSVAASTDKTQSIIVDDLLDTTSYVGSRSCRWTASPAPGKGDDTYCLPGNTCQCPKTTCSGGTADARCYKPGGKPLTDKRKVGDKFKEVTGILQLAFGSYRILPRKADDLKQ